MAAFAGGFKLPLRKPPPNVSLEKQDSLKKEAPFSNFPLKIKFVMDSCAHWCISGEEKTLPDDEAFLSAFQNLSDTVCPQSWRPITRETFCRLAGWKQKRLVEALATGPPKPVYTFPHGRITSADVCSEIDWGSCVGAQKSSDGLEGVYFIELANSRAVVVKCPKSPAPELFGNYLCESFGVRNAKIRAIRRNGYEGRRVVRTLLKFYLEQGGSCKESDALAVRSAFKVPIFLLMEYIPGRELAELSVTSPVALRTALTSPSTLHSFGRLLALDCVLNNFDRLPFGLWQNAGGNPSNIFFTVQSNESFGSGWGNTSNV